MSAAPSVRPRPRRKRVAHYWAERLSTPDIRAQLHSNWKGIPNLFAAHAVWVCSGLAEMQVVLLIQAMTAGKPGGEAEWTEHLSSRDFEAASPFSETMMAIAVERLVEVGAIERKCGCKDRADCEGQGMDHYRYRLRIENWPNIPSPHDQKPAPAAKAKSDEKANAKPSDLVRVSCDRAVKFVPARYEMPEATPVTAVDYERATGASDDIVARLGIDGVLRVTQRPALSAAGSYDPLPVQSPPPKAGPVQPPPEKPDLLPIVNALLDYCQPDEDGVQRLWAKCRRIRPDATVAEVVYFIREKSRRKHGYANPFAFFLDMVPPSFSGKTFVATRAKQQQQTSAAAAASPAQLTKEERAARIRDARGILADRDATPQMRELATELLRDMGEEA